LIDSTHITEHAEIMTRRANCTFSARAVLLSLAVLVCAATADDIAPQFAASPGAQRDRTLARITQPPGAESGSDLIRSKMRLESVRDELRSVIATTEARLAEMSENDPQAKTLMATRDAARRNEVAVEKLLQEIGAQLRLKEPWLPASSRSNTPGK
jgi:hypothetical protein